MLMVVMAFLCEDGVGAAGTLGACWSARSLCRAYRKGSEWPHREPPLPLSTWGCGCRGEKVVSKKLVEKRAWLT